MRRTAERVIRGGGFKYSARWCRAASFNVRRSDEHFDPLGVRPVARTKDKCRRKP